ncbi:hypothetical protein ACGRHY_27285 [Streptomyces sp. HK10]|uniref:hypothetical protein n=1 Tax=Streptomyces sp. HK10 TaxID=3373255 RepID=UPI00374857CC
MVTAVKTAGRWVIDAASLAHRIAIGARRTRKETAVPHIDLTATYTVTYPSGRTPTVITPKVRTRDRNGVTLTTVRGLAPLLAGQIDAITDEGDRLHTLEVLSGASIVIADKPRDIGSAMIATRDDGRLAAHYQGTKGLPVDTVLDLAERLRTQLWEKPAAGSADYTALAAEARDLHARLTPAKDCHPADRIGGHRDRTSGARRGRNAALAAANAFERAAADPTVDTALAHDQLATARRTAAQLGR